MDEKDQFQGPPFYGGRDKRTSVHKLLRGISSTGVYIRGLNLLSFPLLNQLKLSSVTEEMCLLRSGILPEIKAR